MTYQCPCCSYFTFEKELDGTFEICPVCYWEDDWSQNQNPNLTGGANEISLIQAKKNFLIYGAIKPEFVGNVRDPRVEENRP